MGDFMHFFILLRVAQLPQVPHVPEGLGMVPEPSAAMSRGPVPQGFSEVFKWFHPEVWVQDGQNLVIFYMASPEKASKRLGFKTLFGLSRMLEWDACGIESEGTPTILPKTMGHW